MRDGYLSWDDGEVRLGGELLPGVFVEQNVRGAVRFDDAQLDAQSGKAKVPLGYQDAVVTLTLDLLCDEAGDCYQKLEQISRVFKADRNANPKVYAVQNRHLAARGVRNVIFAALDSFEDDREDVIMAVLSFTEHQPAVIRREKQATATRAAQTKAGTAPPVKAKPAVSPKVVSDPENPFMAGLRDGAL